MKKIIRHYSLKVKRLSLKERMLTGQRSESEVGSFKNLKLGVTESLTVPTNPTANLKINLDFISKPSIPKQNINEKLEGGGNGNIPSRTSTENSGQVKSTSNDSAVESESLKQKSNNFDPKRTMDLSSFLKPKLSVASKDSTSYVAVSGSATTNLSSNRGKSERKPSLAERKPKMSFDFNSKVPRPAFNSNSKNAHNNEEGNARKSKHSEDFQTHIPDHANTKPRAIQNRFKHKIDPAKTTDTFENLETTTAEVHEDIFSLDSLEDEITSTEEPEKSGYISKKIGKERERERREKVKMKRQALFEAKQQQAAKPKATKIKNVAIHDGITVANLSVLLNVTLRQLQFQLVKAGFEEYPADYMLTAEVASMIVLEYNMNPILTSVDAVDLVHRPPPADWSQYPLRPPVITIMGHVDHGKTTLLDSLRKTSVAAGEAGGITQHIGAFSVQLPSGKKITFLDTPGHAAFSHMRKRGAQVTDIVVLVVAADDGVMPQTIEAIKHSLEAKVPIIVAINKCDKPGVDPLKIKQDLLRHDIVVEELGGDIPAIHVSGKTGMGLAELEENILAIAEISEYRGDPTGLVEAVIVESQQTSRLGNVATLIVKRGTLTPGAILVAGSSWCKVRKMVDEYGRELSEVLPSNPVEVIGWKNLPNAGDHVLQAESESLAKRVVSNRVKKMEIQTAMESIEEINQKRGIAREKYEIAREETRKLNKKHRIREAQNEEKTIIDESVLRIVLKADVFGSVEAIEGALGALPSHEVRCEILSTGVGAVTESDLDYAKATGAFVFAFNVPISRAIQTMADDIKVTISSQNIIYTLIDKAKEELSKLLKPDIVTEVLGDAIVQEVFEISAKKKNAANIAGCKVLSGKLTRQGLIRVIRDDEIVFEGKMKTFKHHKKDILEASKGLECGIAIEKFDGIQKGDHIVSVSVTERARTI